MRKYLFIAIALTSIAALIYFSPTNLKTFGADSGALSPGTMAVVDTGRSAWTNPNNAKVSDNTYATTPDVGAGSTYFGLNGTGYEYEQVRIVKAGVIGSTDRSAILSLHTTDTYTSFGSSSDLWGETWAAADINASDFGAAFTLGDTKFDDVQTNWLRATNFGFSIPTSATIDGILLEIEAHADATDTSLAYIDHIRITVTYTESSGTVSSQTSISNGTLRINNGTVNQR